MKTCSKCKVEQSKDQFSLDRIKKDRLTSWCRSCKNKSDKERRKRPEEKQKRIDYFRKYTYGITPELFNCMYQEQGGRCKLCEKPFLNTKDTHVDHDHDTKEIRGLLCHTCNTALGKLGDNAEGIRKALAYLTKGNDHASSGNLRPPQCGVWGLSERGSAWPESISGGNW